MANVPAHVLLNSSNEPIIWPPIIVAKKNDDVEIFNFSGGDIVVMYPDNVFKDPNGQLKKSADVANPNGKAKKKVDGGATLGSHAFKVFCYQTNSFAKGNSDPIFIVEP